MARPSYGITEYLTLAREKGLEFTGGTIPETTRIKTYWRCLSCNAVQHKDFHYLKFQQFGCKCQNNARLPIERYQELGEKLGLRLVDNQKPMNIFDIVQWWNNQGVIVNFSYHNLAYDRAPKRFKNLDENA